MITASNEFRTAGPVKQDLTSHNGPYTLFPTFVLLLLYEEWGETQGEADAASIPSVHIMLENLWESNSVMESHGRRFLVDAKEQVNVVQLSDDCWFTIGQRGSIIGRLLVHDRYFNKEIMTANSAHVGLGDAGSWQRENMVTALFN
ncbi:unnamed protein product [Ilex paraguariensis]|uniref:Uncharacterized protein n=1 Tax=Ilex paraguariensis TaxID=185542 RepID=A0ABC8S8Y7_9AQUA